MFCYDSVIKYFWNGEKTYQTKQPINVCSDKYLLLNSEERWISEISCPMSQ